MPFALPRAPRRRATAAAGTAGLLLPKFKTVTICLNGLKLLLAALQGTSFYVLRVLKNLRCEHDAAVLNQLKKTALDIHCTESSVEV